MFAPLPELPGLDQQRDPLAITNPMGLVYDDRLDTPAPAARGSSTPAASSTGSTGSQAKAKASAGSIQNWLLNLVTGGQTGGLSLEDIVFIVIGLLLLAAAFFSFDKTQNVIKTTVKNVRGAIDTKAAEALTA